MGTQSFLVAILGFGIINGIFSPYRLMAQIIVFAMSPGFFISSPSVVLLASSLLTATMTIMLAGVPAALFERISGQQESDTVSMWIWLAGIALLSLPAVQAALAALFR